MIILHVITGLNQGGAEGALLRLVSNSGNPHKHLIISLTDAGIHGKTLVSLGCQVHQLEMTKRRISLRALIDLRRLLKDIKPDVVQTWMYHADLLGGLAAKSLGIPVVWGVRQSNNSFKELGFKTWLVAKACAALSYVVPERIINCSNQSIALHKRFGYADKFDHVPNGFHVEEAAIALDEKQSYTSKLRLAPDALVFGHMARFHPMKNHQGFLQAFAQVAATQNNAIAVMVGTGVLDENQDFFLYCQTAILDKLRLLGPRKDTEALFRIFDIFVMSSSWGEAFPNVVAEAMLQGTPCVVTEVGDAAEIVGDTGWVVPPNDVNALAVAMLKAANLSCDERQRRGQAARQRIIDNYGIDKMVSRFETVWQQAIARSKN